MFYLHAVNFHIGGQIGGGCLWSKAKRIKEISRNSAAKPAAQPLPNDILNGGIALEEEFFGEPLIQEPEEDIRFHPEFSPQFPWFVYVGISHHINRWFFGQLNILAGSWKSILGFNQGLNMKAFGGLEGIVGFNFFPKFFIGLSLGLEQTWVDKVKFMHGFNTKSQSDSFADSSSFSYPIGSIGCVLGWRIVKFLTWNIIKVQGLYGFIQTKNLKINNRQGDDENLNMNVSLKQLRITTGIEVVI